MLYPTKLKNKLKAIHNAIGMLYQARIVVSDQVKEQIESNSQLAHPMIRQ
jgi:hypothetical protein